MGWGHKQAIRCSASLLRHKAPSGAEESQREPKTCLAASPPPDKVFKALKCSADSPALPRTGWVLFTFNAEEIHGAQGTRRNTTEYIRVLQKMHGEQGRCQCGASPSKEIFQVRLRHLVTLNPSFAPLQNWKLQALSRFSPSLFALCIRV